MRGLKVLEGGIKSLASGAKSTLQKVPTMGTKAKPFKLSLVGLGAKSLEKWDFSGDIVPRQFHLLETAVAAARSRACEGKTVDPTSPRSRPSTTTPPPSVSALSTSVDAVPSSVPVHLRFQKHECVGHSRSSYSARRSSSLAGLARQLRSHSPPCLSIAALLILLLFAGRLSRRPGRAQEAQGQNCTFPGV